MNLFVIVFPIAPTNGTVLGEEGSGVGGQGRVGVPVSTKNFSDLPATSSCTLGYSPMMVICDRWADWSSPLQSCWTIVGKAWHLTLRLLGPQGRVPPKVSIDGILGDLSQFWHSLSHCPACLQIRHLPHPLWFKGSGFAMGLHWRAVIIWACLVPFLFSLSWALASISFLCYRR